MYNRYKSKQEQKIHDISPTLIFAAIFSEHEMSFLELYYFLEVLFSSNAFYYLLQNFAQRKESC